MAKYYNAETLLEFIKQNTPHIEGETTMQCVERAIKEAPPADVVEVVRCKDCKYYAPDKKSGLLHTPCGRIFALCICHEDSFCSYGERKEGTP